jgi:hypothetical protein
MPETGPHLILATFCEKVIEEKDGVLSLIRLVDRFTQTASGADPPPQMPPFIISDLKLVLTLKPDQARGRFAVKIVAEDPELYVVPLICLAGIAETLDRASNRSVGDGMPLGMIIGMALVLGPLFGLIKLWLGSHLLHLTGRWIGGTSPVSHLRTAIAWASVPTVVALALWALLIVVFGSELFSTETPRLDNQPLLAIPLGAIVLGQMVLAVWGVVLACNTIAEVQGFRSAWRGLANIVLAMAIIIVPLVVMMFGVVFLLR